VVTFAEGTRSPDGTLKQFKKGPFKMSKKAGVRIIPVSICDLWRWMPPSAILPLGYPRQVEIKIHPPVETAGRDESEVERETFAAINSGLPEFQVRSALALPSYSVLEAVTTYYYAYLRVVRDTSSSRKMFSNTSPPPIGFVSHHAKLVPVALPTPFLLPSSRVCLPSQSNRQSAQRALPRWPGQGGPA